MCSLRVQYENPLLLKLAIKIFRPGFYTTYVVCIAFTFELHLNMDCLILIKNFFFFYTKLYLKIQNFSN